MALLREWKSLNSLIEPSSTSKCQASITKKNGLGIASDFHN